MFTLILQDERDWRRLPLKAGETTIGRAPGNDVVVGHPSVSRRHARVVVDGGGCHIHDLDSALRTYVNGEAVTDAALRHGDVITIGQVRLRVEESPDGVVLEDSPGAVAEAATIVRATRVVPTVHSVADPVAADPPLARAERLLALLAEATGALTRTRDQAEILDRIAGLTFEIVPAERLFVLLLDPLSGELVPRLARGRNGRPPGATSISRAVVRKVMTDKMALLSSDAQVDCRLDPSESLQVQRVRSFMCAPLWTEAAVFGVLYIDTARARSFSSSDLDLFTTVSNYAAVAIEQARLADRLFEQTKRTERLQRYHSPAVAERILQQQGDTAGSLVAHERDVSVLFADLVGFTRMSEGMAAIEIGAVLNGFFSAMTEVIFRHEGTLDKFIGDAVLAVFGAPLSQADHAQRAVQTAIGMREALVRLNARRTPHLQMRVAVNSGRALVGDIGAASRREFTVLGDVVNTAARMQGELCAPGQIVISGATYAQLRPDVQVTPLGSAVVKGRAAPVEIYAVQ